MIVSVFRTMLYMACVLTCNIHIANEDLWITQYITTGCGLYRHVTNDTNNLRNIRFCHLIDLA